MPPRTRFADNLEKMCFSYTSGIFDAGEGPFSSHYSALRRRMSFQKLILVTSRLVTKITPLIDLICHGEWNTRVDPLIRAGMSCDWCHVQITGI